MNGIRHVYQAQLSPDGDLFFVCPVPGCGWVYKVGEDGRLLPVERGADPRVMHAGAFSGMPGLEMHLSGIEPYANHTRS